VKYQPVRKERPFPLRHDFHQRGLDFDGIGVAGEPEPRREPRNVRVDDDTGVLAEGVCPKRRSRSCADAGQPDDLPCFAAPRRHAHRRESAAGADVFRLVAVEPDGAQVVLEPGRAGFGVGARRAVFFEERGRDLLTWTSVD